MATDSPEPVWKALPTRHPDFAIERPYWAWTIGRKAEKAIALFANMIQCFDIK